MFGTKASFFINGLEVDGTPFETMNLQGEIADDSTAQTRVGQRMTGTVIKLIISKLENVCVYKMFITLFREIIRELFTKKV